MINHILNSINRNGQLKPYIEFNSQKRIEAEKMGTKMENLLQKLMINALYGRKKENLRNRLDLKLVKQRKRLFIMNIKNKLYVQKIFDNNLVPTEKSKVSLKPKNLHTLEYLFWN